MSPKDGWRLALLVTLLVAPPAFFAYRLGRKQKPQPPDYERFAQ